MNAVFGDLDRSAVGKLFGSWQSRSFILQHLKTSSFVNVGNKIQKVTCRSLFFFWVRWFPRPQPQDGEASERPSDVASEDDEAGEVFWDGLGSKTLKVWNWCAWWVVTIHTYIYIYIIHVYISMDTMICYIFTKASSSELSWSSRLPILSLSCFISILSLLILFQ